MGGVISQQDELNNIYIWSMSTRKRNRMIHVNKTCMRRELELCHRAKKKQEVSDVNTEFFLTVCLWLERQSKYHFKVKWLHESSHKLNPLQMASWPRSFAASWPRHYDFWSHFNFNYRWDYRQPFQRSLGWLQGISRGNENEAINYRCN